MKYTALLFPLILAGCTSKMGTTVPGQTNHQSIGHGYTDTESVEMAVYTAEKYCEKQGKRHAVDKLQTSYKGVVSEKTRQTVDTVSDVAAYTGVWLPGVGDDDDYKTVAFFRCL